MTAGSQKSPIPANLGQILRDTARRFPKKPALFFKENGHYRSYTWSEVSRKVRALAGFYIEEGLEPGDRLAILSENRPEWAIADLAAQSLGIVTVPVYPSLSGPEIQYILKDSGAKMLALSSRSMYGKVGSQLALLPGLRSLLAFDSGLSVESPPIELTTFSEAVRRAPLDMLTELSERIRPESLASIIYTSGTTGVPKGVMLTHRNFVHNVLMCKDAFRMDENDAHISFLPLCHVFERTAGYYLMVHIGASISYAENMDSVPKNIVETRPTFILGVPRFFEKVRSRVLESVRQSPEGRQRLFRRAQELGAKRRLGKPFGWRDRLFWPIAALLVRRKFQPRLACRLRFCLSGGAPLAKEIAEFFCDLGVMIYEGYGLTETAPVISANREGRVRFGSIGIPLKGVEVRISEEGEILTKSACVMKGYYNLPQDTVAAIEGGWFHTGDLGRIDADGFLFITGRKKELIVTSNGKKISPRPIEEVLEKDPYILRAVLYGEGKKFITALIVPREAALVEYAKSQKIAFSDYAGLLPDKKVQAFLDRRIQQAQSELADYEKVKYFLTLPEDFTQDAGELTPTLKVKREAVLSRYKERLEALYADA